MPGRVFTADEATRTLPLVRRIVADAVRIYARLRRRVAILRRIRSESVPADRVARIRDRVERLGSRLEGYASELTEVGCQIKDYERGLVDFAGLVDGRAVELCWMLGEATVAHWHEIGAGYAGRHPLLPEPVRP